MPAQEPLMDDAEYLVTIGHEFQRARIARGLSREELAWAAGVHVNTISIIERGERDISVMTQKSILAALGCVGLEILSDRLIIILDEKPGSIARIDIQAMPESMIIELVGNALHEARTRSGLSLEELALRVGVHRNSLWNYEHGLVVPCCLVVYRLYWILGISRVSPTTEGVGPEHPSKNSQ